MPVPAERPAAERPAADRPIAVLFVCLGNICRSPLAEAAFRQAAADAGLADRFRIDSAGVSDYHEGDPPDRRALAAGAARGLALTHLRARPVRPADFVDFDVILAMDESNLAALADLAPDVALARLGLFLEVAEGRRESIPDPYFGGPAGFETVLDTLQRASVPLVRRLAGNRDA